jgi:type I restriction enzyme M protein
MKPKISLNEASQLLGVSKETLRNWDRAGTLKSKRNPANNYRTYALDDVLRLKEDSPIPSLPAQTKSAGPAAPQTGGGMTEEVFKRHLARLHRSLRDAHGDSSLIGRFDEISKLLFAKALSEKTPGQHDLFNQLLEENAAYAGRIRKFYEQACAKFSVLVPERFRQLNLPDEAIIAAGEVLSALQLTNAAVDIKGVAYEEVVRNTFDKGDNQQFFTPREIAAFLVAMLANETHGAVCDPASGTGGFLVEMLRQDAKVASFTALEVDERLAWVTGINLFLTGANEFQSIYLGNGGSLGAKGESFIGTFNVIITNPPFGSDYSDSASLQKYELGRGLASRRRGILFIERCLDMLKPGGVLGMVIDEGVLSLSSTQDVREFIQRRAELLAVVSMPETAFMPYASVNTSIIILRKAKKPAHGLTFFAKSERVGRTSRMASQIRPTMRMETRCQTATSTKSLRLGASFKNVAKRYPTRSIYFFPTRLPMQSKTPNCASISATITRRGLWRHRQSSRANIPWSGSAKSASSEMTATCRQWISPTSSSTTLASRRSSRARATQLRSMCLASRSRVE